MEAELAYKIYFYSSRRGVEVTNQPSENRELQIFTPSDSSKVAEMGLLIQPGEWSMLDSLFSKEPWGHARITETKKMATHGIEAVREVIITLNDQRVFTVSASSTVLPLWK